MLAMRAVKEDGRDGDRLPTTRGEEMERGWAFESRGLQGVLAAAVRCCGMLTYLVMYLVWVAWPQGTREVKAMTVMIEDL